MMEKMTQQEMNREYFLKIAIQLTPPEHTDHIHISVEAFKNLIESAWMSGQCEAMERKYTNEGV
jgi:hypothetical protein